MNCLNGCEAKNWYILEWFKDFEVIVSGMEWAEQLWVDCFVIFYIWSLCKSTNILQYSKIDSQLYFCKKHSDLLSISFNIPRCDKYSNYCTKFRKVWWRRLVLFKQFSKPIQINLINAFFSRRQKNFTLTLEYWKLRIKWLTGNNGLRMIKNEKVKIILLF
jgi:hypothetical protein